MTLLQPLFTGSMASFAGGNVTLTPVNGPLTLETFKKRVRVNGGHLLHSPRNNGFVEELKSLVPWYALRWDKERKVWWVDTPYVTAVVLDVIADFFDPALRGELEALRVGTAAVELIAVVE